MNNEVKKDDNLINHIRNVKLLQAIHSGKKFYVDCFPTDEGALRFPNSNRAVREIELPNFELYEEKLGYSWVKDSNPKEPEAVHGNEAEKKVCVCQDPLIEQQRFINPPFNEDGTCKSCGRKHTFSWQT